MQTTPKRQARAARSPAKGSRATEAPARPVGPRLTTVQLVERVTALQLRQAPLEVLGDEMLPALLDAFDAPAGALLIYRCEDESLALVTSRGLSPAGRQHVECLRRGSPEAWEIPLHGLLNRKAYIIERPTEHPFVPELVARDELPLVTNLASIPLYRGQLPVGVLLVIADRRPVSESEILARVLAFDVLALALETFVRSRAGLASRAPTPAPSPDSSLSCEPWVDPLEAARQLEAQLATVTGERQVLALRLAETEVALADVTRALDAERNEGARLLTDREAAAEEHRIAERAAAEAALDRLGVALTERDATLAARDRTIALVSAERDRARQATEEANGLAERLRAQVQDLDRRLAAARASETEAQGRAGAAGSAAAALEHELGAARAEVERLHEERARVVAAIDDPEAEPAAVIGALRSEIAALEGQVAAVAAERAALAARAATTAEEGEHRLALQARALEELRADHERAFAASRAETQRRLEETYGGHQRELAAARTAHQHEIADLRATHQRELAEIRAQGAEALAHALEVSEARSAEIARLGAQCDDLEARLQWALAEREEAAAAASARERASLDRLEAERGAAAMARASLEEQIAALGRESAEQGARMAALERELAHRDDTIAAAATRGEALDHELAAVRAEAARLREDRELVLAAVDDPSAEPAAVIRALRETVAALQGQLGTFDVERAELTRRADAEREEAAHRLATHARELEDVRHAHQHELAGMRAAAERLEAERRAGLQRLESEREAALASAGELRAVLNERTIERDRLRQTSGENGEIVRQLRAEVAALHGQQTTLAERVTTEQARVTALEQELARREEIAAEAARQAQVLGDELTTVRGEVVRLREDRERVLAAVADADAEPAAVIGALREQVQELEVELERLAGERNDIKRRSAAAEDRSTERLASLRRDLEELRAQHQRELATLEAANRRTLEEARAGMEREIAAARAAAQRAREEQVPEPAEPAAGASDPLGAALAFRPPEVSAGLTVDVIVGEQEAGVHRILEADGARRRQVAEAVAALPGLHGRHLLVANLLSAVPAGLEGVTAASRAGNVVVAYAADGHGRSRILGAVRCLAEPPSAEEALAALAMLPRGVRRVITLSDDVDAFIGAKAGLTKAGHSVSMACDSKQALDLLAILTPEVVLVDLRTAPEAAAEFLGALAPESGRVLSLLVYGDRSGDALGRVLQRLLRPEPLEPSDLLRVCDALLRGETPPPMKDEGARPVRGLERPITLPRKTVARRVLPRRR